ncbi:MAG: DUF4838 domain-containing protein [Oscillospiraceae bacterium]|nr:DUF4838 domain-containing protein [Oscillospiraceae bacterium]
MFHIYKMRDDHVLDFAAEELKKYLWMMMPECGNTPIAVDPNAKDGFRLGLLEDFGLPNEAKDPVREDVVHIDTDEKGGILAGSNVRSVLFAVYRFLRLNGCRWLFPGIDGEYIPRKNIEPQKYHKLADHWYRGHTTEGDPSIEQVMDFIDYNTKQEQNYFAPLGVHTYHERYYAHNLNEMNREPEPVPQSQYDQWKGLYLAEITKRGLLICDGEHGDCPRSIGILPEDRSAYIRGEKFPTEEMVSKMAMLKGKRGLRKNVFDIGKYNFGDPNNTQLCYSQPEVRTNLVNVIAEFVEANQHLDNVHINFADANHNYCECEACGDTRPADFMIMVANELDEVLTKRGIKTKLVFYLYVDLMFAPIKERLNNPDRFFIQFAPITRSYTSSVYEDTIIPPPNPYVKKNVWDAPKTMEGCVALLKEWQKDFPVQYYTYEYHFWRAQYRDPGLVDISRRMYEDVLSMKLIGCQGILEDGSNKSYFPHGFHDHICAETLVDRDLDYNEQYADYMLHLYGDDWKQVNAYLTGISEAFGEKYMAGEDSADPAKGTHYNPGRVPYLTKVKELAAMARDLAAKHKVMPTRPQTVAYRLLNRHAQYCQRLAEIFLEKCQGHDKFALEMMEKFIADYGKYDFELERYFDFGLAMSALKVIVKQMPTIEF